MVESLPQTQMFHLAVDPLDPGFALNDSPENLPFLFEPKGAPQAAVLLVHGFTATPWEMRPLGEALSAAGFAALGLCLPGHGTMPKDLSSIRYEAWLQEVERGYQLLAQTSPRVYGIGMSTGGLLLLALAGQQRLHGLVLFSPFLRLRHWLAPLIVLLRHIKPYQKRKLAPHLAAHYYSLRPLNGIYQIQRLIRRLRRVLPDISAPTLIFSAQGDQTVDAASAKTLLRTLGSRDKRFHQFGPEMPHVLTTRENPLWAETVERTIQFLRELEGTEQPSAGQTEPEPAPGSAAETPNCRSHSRPG